MQMKVGAFDSFVSDQVWSHLTAKNVVERNSFARS